MHSALPRPWRGAAVCHPRTCQQWAGAQQLAGPDHPLTGILFCGLLSMDYSDSGDGWRWFVALNSFVPLHLHEHAGGLVLMLLEILVTVLLMRLSPVTF